MKDPLVKYYCDICKSEFDRIDLGYNPHELDCGRWQCKILDKIQLLLLIIILPIFLILLSPIIILIVIVNIFDGTYER